MNQTKTGATELAGQGHGGITRVLSMNSVNFFTHKFESGSFNNQNHLTMATNHALEQGSPTSVEFPTLIMRAFGKFCAFSNNTNIFTRQTINFTLTNI